MSPDLTITNVEAMLLRHPDQGPRDWWHTSPRDVFMPDYERLDLPGIPNEVVVRVETADGVSGLGVVGVGNPAHKTFIDSHLTPLVIGKSAFDRELIWEWLFRATINVGRKGIAIEAISAIDIALWDIVGRALGQPVYNILGGRVKKSIPAYASRLLARDSLAETAAEARALREAGFKAVKMRAGFGPFEGRAGMRKNQEAVGTVRDAIGPDVGLAVDVYMGWNVTYAIEMIKILEEFGLLWVEEPVVPDDYDGYARIRSRVATPISGGEHEFTRWGFNELIKRGCVDILQPDVNRVGGITEAQKIFALASAHNLDVIPHADGIHNVHLVASHLNAPWIEATSMRGFSSDSGAGDDVGLWYDRTVFLGDPEVVDGQMTVPNRPGLGVELNEPLVAELRVA